MSEGERPGVEMAGLGVLGRGGAGLGDCHHRECMGQYGECTGICRGEERVAREKVGRRIGQKKSSKKLPTGCRPCGPRGHPLKEPKG